MKSITFQFLKQKDYLEVSLTGELNFNDFVELIDIVENEAANSGMSKIFFDMSQLKGDLTILERFQFAEELVNKVKMRYKICVLDQPKRINKMAENTAVNRGINLLVTDDSEAGLFWLTGK